MSVCPHRLSKFKTSKFILFKTTLKCHLIWKIYGRFQLFVPRNHYTQSNKTTKTVKMLIAWFLHLIYVKLIFLLITFLNFGWHFCANNAINTLSLHNFFNSAALSNLHINSIVLIWKSYLFLCNSMCLNSSPQNPKTVFVFFRILLFSSGLPITHVGQLFCLSSFVLLFRLTIRHSTGLYL